MEKRYLHEDETFQDCIERLHLLNKDSLPTWGAMSVAQMFSHCAEVQEVCNGSKLLNGTSLLSTLYKAYIKKESISPTPYQRNHKTHPQFVQLEEKDFDKEKARLIKALTQFKKKLDTAYGEHTHPLYGLMTKAEMGWAMYRHLHHHLLQFEV
ncbi:DUF1569 domain-containing protein [Persicobacter psychrovividus]|uniref:DUF1569 domain-containing protein n=1 Tax=Persicobacter psychrovividus TaxID=387638 RepID=A0ABM7VFD8_9BACT|nr:hypothetical protein PEPS_19620 [Persicobacter psychrovividus]